jgi:succinyl-diaminopimelate desuccinylase
VTATLDLTLDLLRRRSVSPADEGCQDVIIRRLEVLGFQVERLRFGPVDNFWATREGSVAGSGPTLCLAGHTDVVPTGPLAAWATPPFEPTLRDGKLYARGACDDKGQVYMHLSAIEAHLAVNKALPPRDTGSVIIISMPPPPLPLPPPPLTPPPPRSSSPLWWR